MKVILQKDVTNLGDAGEVKEVADGYARNFLIPRRLAIRASEGTSRAATHNKKLVELKKQKRVSSMKVLAGQIENTVITIPVKVGENDKLFGSVTTAEIVSNLKKQVGVDVDKRKVELADPIKALGEFKLKLKLADGITPSFSVKVVKKES